MKKQIGLAVVLILMLALTGCGNGGNGGRSGAAHKAGGSKSVNDVLNEGVKKEEEKNNAQSGNQTVTGDPSQSGNPGNGTDPAPKTEGVDIDLTTMSSTMVYSEVNNIVNEPEKYIGKTIKMNGVYAFVYDDSNTKRYDACIIQDATACCGGGIEFELTGDYKYPDDYPEEGGDICVIGVFDTYTEGDYIYCTLRNARKVQ